MEGMRIAAERDAQGSTVLRAVRGAHECGSVVLAAAGESAAWPAALVLRDLRVDPPWRRRGLGAALVAAVEELAAASGAELLVLEVDTSNAAAARLYASRGWLPVGEPSAYSYTSLDDGGAASVVEVSRQTWAKAL
ncbi:GNAT family N-acetyltransferase [Pseudarthrobacter sp. P1]|uniref:GNAT family N-acetyltransferase n=1 Tax=Pseudarthrobacter sp. P1 TaxID=3418418 RepID=UPI003CEDEDB5